jgi:acetylcholinesterase
MYHGASLVEHSLEWDEPVVYVSINYRVNFFGFLASKELAKDNAAHGGGVGNYGTSLLDAI